MRGGEGTERDRRDGMENGSHGTGKEGKGTDMKRKTGEGRDGKWRVTIGNGKEGKGGEKVVNVRENKNRKENE